MLRAGARDQEYCLVLLGLEHQRLDQGTVVLPQRMKAQRWSRWVLVFFIVPNGGSKVGVGWEWWWLTQW